MADRAIRVLLVDDHAMVRRGMRDFLDLHDDIEVVGEAVDGMDAVERSAELRPDVVVMDLMMDGIGGIEATRRIKSDFPDVNVLVLTMAADRAYLREAFGVGASGYVLKDAVDVELLDAVRAVAEGGRYLHPALGAELVRAEDESKRGPRTPHGVPLSRREVDVLRCVARGYSNKEIADELNIGLRTVETHKTHIMQKTSLRARSELTKFAQEAGILDATEDVG